MGATVALDSVYSVTAKSGKVYLYAWKGKGASRLKEEPGTDAFITELADALKGRKIGDKSKMAGLCALWRASDAWQKPREQGGLADSTKKNWAPFLDDIQEHFGQLSVGQFDRVKAIRPFIKRWRDKRKPHLRQCDMAKQVLSALLSFGIEENLLENNACHGLKNYYANDRADRIWKPADLSRLDATGRTEVIQAARLAALTGLRQTDLLRLTWSRIEPLAICLKTGKGGGTREVLIPMYDELREHLAAIPKRGPIVLTNTDGLPWQSGFSSSWNKALIAAGFKSEDGKHDEDLHFHDLRGTAATRMFLGGLTIREIAEIMGWSEDETERLINRYVKRDELLRDRIRRLNENTRRTDLEKSPEKSSA